MESARIFITGAGIISSLGRGVTEHYAALKKNITYIKPITLFSPSPGNVYPAGEIKGFTQTTGLPRTHELALIAAQEAMENKTFAPDAIIIGTTTGGMPLTETLLKEGATQPEQYRYHSTSSVAEYLADIFRCTGPVMTITTACSSSAVAMILGRELIRSGKAARVLAGGVDALCRLTYYGFNSLQLIDPAGARPLDRTRRGMTVSEGAAMLLLESSSALPDHVIMEIAGGGLSCDAYHPATPHPEGSGALSAMNKALADAGMSMSDIGYINLHGTGTIENDRSEAKAIHALFGSSIPPLSSVKGATGHSLAAAGAIEAVISGLSITGGFIPANTGCIEPDPELGLAPVLAPAETAVKVVMSNSFGFGGNNACLIFADPKLNLKPSQTSSLCRFSILGISCITGAGDTEATMTQLANGNSCKGTLPLADILNKLPAREIRRLKRLTRIALSLAIDACDASGAGMPLSSVFFGTGWGPLSETHDFLSKLFESHEQFVSPTDFVGSVHNAPAGQIAIVSKAHGPNITVTGGDYSFEQALLAAALTGNYTDEAMLVMGADEHHEALSPLFDGSVLDAATASDGGGALCLKKNDGSKGLRIAPIFYQNSRNNPLILQSLAEKLAQEHDPVNKRYGAVFVGMPATDHALCIQQLEHIISATGFSGIVVDYRKFLGEFASASAAAAACAARFVRDGVIPAHLAGGQPRALHGAGILLLGLGAFVTAIEILA